MYVICNVGMLNIKTRYTKNYKHNMNSYNFERLFVVLHTQQYDRRVILVTFRMFSI